MKTLIKVISRIGDAYLRQRLEIECARQEFQGLNERATEFRFVFAQIAELAPTDVLDVGSGTTALPALIRSCGCRVEAIDNVRDYWPDGMINRHFHVADDDIRAPTIRGAYDLVTCVSVLEHIKEHSAAVRGMFSMVKPGGHLVITCPYSENRYHQNVYEAVGSTAVGSFPFTTQSFSRSELEHWLSENDASLVKQEFWRFYTGALWTVGQPIWPPEPAAADSPHQITCLLLRKKK
jgi:2-polyprenyl-3-methyl-5-hydroxy-6-metoxy-1,4-benzoquinol methylase